MPKLTLKPLDWCRGGGEPKGGWRGEWSVVMLLLLLSLHEVDEFYEFLWVHMHDAVIEAAGSVREKWREKWSLMMMMMMMLLLSLHVVDEVLWVVLWVDIHDVCHVCHVVTRSRKYS